MTGIYLEPLTIEKHLSDFHAIVSDPQTMRWSTQNPKKNLTESQAWMELLLPSDTNPDIEKMAIMIPSSNSTSSQENDSQAQAKMIGFVGTNRPSAQGIEFGYCVNREYWNRGIAREAVKEYLIWYWGLNERKHVKNLVAKIDDENIASRCIMVRIGARRGEVLDDNTLYAARTVDEGGNAKEKVVRCWYIDRPES